MPLVGPDRAQEIFAEATKDRTTIKPGARVFRAYFPKED
jgi:hypothetical protein